MKMTFLSAVIFDMDGVISDTMPYHFRAWRRVFLENGLKVSRFDVYSREGQKGTTSIQDIFAQAKMAIPVSQAKKIINDKERLFKQIIRQRFISGSRSLVRTLHREGIRLALVTGTSRHEVEHTLPPPLLKMFEAVITSNDVVMGKPHPEPYLKALKALGISADRAVVIENAPFGILSAKAAGIKCYAVTTSLPPEYLKRADKVFRNLADLSRTVLNDTGINEEKRR